MDDFNGYPLGCLVPTTFPTMFVPMADKVTMMTRDEVNAALSIVKDSMHGSRAKYPAADWIKDQGPYGACNGYSIAAAEEKMRVLRGNERVKLSGADAYSQMNGGHDQGSALADGMQIVQANGIAPESMVTIDQIYTSRISSQAKAARARFKGFECYAIDTELDLATAIILEFYCVIAVQVDRPAFDRLDGDGRPQSGNGPGNHSVHVDDVRLKDGKLQFDSPNNWTIRWGDQGRCRYEWDRHLRECVKNHRFYAVRSTGDDPDGTNPPEATP